MPPADSQLREVQRLFLEHSLRLRGFVLGLVADRATAEDVLHEVFLTVTTKAGEFELGTDFLAWARAIARFKAGEARRRPGLAARSLDDSAWQAVADAASESDDAWAPQREALAACLEELAPKARQVIDLRYASPALSLEEIARRMAWTVGSVKVALTRARQALWECTQRRMAATAAAHLGRQET